MSAALYPDASFMDLILHPVIPVQLRVRRLAPKLWKVLKRHVHESSGWRCIYCDVDVRRWAVCDHVVPLSRGGTNDRGNLATSCDECNVLKRMLTGWEFLHKLSAIHRRTGASA